MGAQGDAMPRAVELQPGEWYAAAIDTSPIPVSLALDTIEETFANPEHKFGSLKIYREKSELPPEVGPSIRNNPDANVWITGQFEPPDGKPITLTLPKQILAVEQMKVAPPKEHAIEKTDQPGNSETGGDLPTSYIVGTLVVATVIGGGIVAAAWWYLKKKKKKKKNPKRRRR